MSGEAKQIDLVDYLAALGYRPQKIRNHDYWYYSPLREEKTASFKVNRQRNLWYDHGIGKGGTLIDFGMLYFNCSVKEVLDRLSNDSNTLANSFFHPPVTPVNLSPSKTLFAGEKKEA